MTVHIDPRMTKAMVQLTLDFPFFGFLCSRLQMVRDDSQPTMATDSRRVYYGQPFLETLSESELIFVLLHETMHCVLNHCTRRHGRDHDMWNIACDYVVNLAIVEAGFMLPQRDGLKPFFDTRFQGMTVDAVFDILKAEQQAQQPQPEDDDQDDDQDDDASSPESEDDDSDEDGDDGEGDEDDDEPGEAGDDDGQSDTDQDGDNQGEGDEGDDNPEADQPGDGAREPADAPSDEGQGDGPSGEKPSHGRPTGDPGRCGAVIDAAPEHDAAAVAEAELEMEVAVRQATNVERRVGEGKLPGFIKEIIGELSAPQQDWRAALRQWASPCSTKDYTWSKVNGRHAALGYHSPGTIDDGIGHIVVAIDDSGSVDRDMLSRFGGELQSILDEGVVDKVTVLIADDGVHAVREYGRGDLLDFTEVDGRGGTAFAPTFAWVDQNVTEDVTGLVYFTDLDCTSFGQEPAYPVLWAGYEHPVRRAFLKQRMTNVPFGDCIELN
jgi:predicted metal-dependent peptidase